MGKNTLTGGIETLRARYFELLRLRDHVGQLEGSLQDTTKRRTVERSEVTGDWPECADRTVGRA